VPPPPPPPPQHCTVTDVTPEGTVQVPVVVIVCVDCANVNVVPTKKVITEAIPLASLVQKGTVGQYILLMQRMLSFGENNLFLHQKKLYLLLQKIE
jgi:hypothetical protein